ncbi:unnamed protein product, partial [Oppiella nova]
DVVCIPQMMEMLSCFKTNDFDQSKCGPQITAFQSCYDKYVDDRKTKELNNDDVIPTPGQQKLSKDQMNVLLQRWPQPK